MDASHLNQRTKIYVPKHVDIAIMALLSSGLRVAYIYVVPGLLVIPFDFIYSLYTSIKYKLEVFECILNF